VGGDYFIDATGSTYINAFVGNIISFMNVHGLDTKGFLSIRNNLGLRKQFLFHNRHYICRNLNE
jgi:hypothetical protein